MEDRKDLAQVGRDLRQQSLILGGVILLFWAIEGIDFLLGGSLDRFGIIPRQVSGLWRIFSAPLLHGGFAHLVANTLPFLILGWLVLLRGSRTFVIVLLSAAVIGGLGTWLIAPANSIHIGSSGLVFGFLGYLIFRGYFERSWQAILLAALVLFVYGSMLLGLFPSGMMVSWQMHLFGFVGGAVAAYGLSNGRARPQA